MTVECSRRGAVAVVKAAGRMDAESASQFDQACQGAIDGGAKHLVVDLADLQYVSSMGLRSFLSFAKILQKSGGKMALCGMKGLVKEVFDLTHLTPLFPMFDSVEAAIESM
jgi:anti-anti-sigma factor